MRPEIVEATEMDFIRFFRQGVPEMRWKGRSVRKGKLVKAMAGVVQGGDGRFFAFMELHGVARYPLVFRHALRFLREVTVEYGVDEIFAFCDRRYPRAQEFIQRLGFEPTDEEIGNQRVWRWQA